MTFGYLTNDEDPFGYIEAVNRLLPAIILFGVYPELCGLMNLQMIKSALPKVTDKFGIGRVMGLSSCLILQSSEVLTSTQVSPKLALTSASERKGRSTRRKSLLDLGVELY